MDYYRTFHFHKKEYSTMFILLITIIISLFAGMLFLNIYFRIKVMKNYRELVQARVQFGAEHIFNKQKMEAEIYPRYPDQIPNIKIFVDNMQYSIRMASVLIVLIIAFGWVLMRYR